MYYSTIVYTSMLLGSSSSMDNSRVVAVLYTVVSPTPKPSPTPCGTRT